MKDYLYLGLTIVSGYALGYIISRAISKKLGLKITMKPGVKRGFPNRKKMTFIGPTIGPRQY